MTKSTSIAITDERLRLWQSRLESEHQCTTPVCLVSVCHGEDSGTVVLSFPEDLTEEFVACVLVKAAQLVVKP